MSTPALEPRQRAFHAAFVTSLVAGFTPLKAVAHALPIAITCWLLWAGVASRNRAVLAALVVLALPLAYIVSQPEFLVVNYGVWILTFSAFLPVLLIDGRVIRSRALFDRVQSACTWMLLVQGCVGIVQAVYGATQTGTFSADNGDYVAGTIYPYLAAERAFSNPMFATNMALLLLVVLGTPAAFDRKRRIRVAIGAMAFVLASVLHVIVFLVVSIIGALALVRTSTVTAPGTRRRLLIATLLVAGVAYVALPENVRNISRVAETALDLDAVDIPRAVLLGQVAYELPEERPSQPYVGVGPGQFCSRASLIMSGMYLGGPDHPKALPLLSPQTTRLAWGYCIELLLTMAALEGDVGSSQQPFFSVLTIYTELGVIGLAVVLGWFIRILVGIRRRARADESVRPLSVALVAGCVLVMLLGFQSNYWETPQALFSGLLLLKLMHANIQDEETDTR